MKPKVGDMVRLKPLRVAYVWENESFSVDGLQAIPCWRSNDIEEILPRAVEVGDKVRYRDSTNPNSVGVIIAIYEDCAWVKRHSNSRGLVTELLSALRRCES